MTGSEKRREQVAPPHDPSIVVPRYVSLRVINASGATIGVPRLHLSSVGCGDHADWATIGVLQLLLHVESCLLIILGVS